MGRKPPWKHFVYLSVMSVWLSAWNYTAPYKWTTMRTSKFGQNGCNRTFIYLKTNRKLWTGRSNSRIQKFWIVLSMTPPPLKKTKRNQVLTSARPALFPPHSCMSTSNTTLQATAPFQVPQDQVCNENLVSAGATLTFIVLTSPSQN